jgi:hypothetical protein
MNRRTFAGRLLTGLGAIALAGTQTACWFSGSLFTQILGYVGVGLTAFNAVVALVDPGAAAGVAVIIALVKAGFADLQLAVQAYNNAPAASKATWLGKISVVLSDLQTEIQSFWVGLRLPGGTIATLISGLLSIILSTLAGFAGQLPPPPAGARLKGTPFGALPVTPHVRSKKQFESDFNKALTDAGQPAVQFS